MLSLSDSLNNVFDCRILGFTLDVESREGISFELFDGALETLSNDTTIVVDCEDVEVVYSMFRFEQGAEQVRHVHKEQDL
jgi:hypothetical protein